MKRLFEETKNELSVGKLILVAILVACLVFILIEKDVFYKEQPYSPRGVEVKHITPKESVIMSLQPEKLKDDDERWLAKVAPAQKGYFSMKGNVKVTQEFEAEHSILQYIQIYCDNVDGAGTKGKLRFTLRDSNGKKLERTEMDTSLIAHRDISEVDFRGNTEALNSNEIVTTVQESYDVDPVKINNGEKYTLEIESLGVKSKGRFGMYFCDGSDKTITASLNGKEQTGKYLYSAIDYSKFNLSVFLALAAAIVLGIIMLLLPYAYLSLAWSRKRAAKGKGAVDLNRLLLRIMFFATPVVVVFINSKIADDRILDFLKLQFSIKGLLNLLIIGLLWWIVYVITNRMKASIFVTTLIGFTFAFTNYLLILFRDSPLIASDFAILGTALDVAATYHVTFSKACLWAIVVATVWICVAMGLKGGKSLTLKRRLVACLALLVWIGAFYLTVFQDSVLTACNIKVSGFKPNLNYKKNGYVLSFFVTVNTSRIQKPSGYSVDETEKIMNEYKSDESVKVTNTTKKNPNIIVVMDEAFSDLKDVGDFETNKEYMPYYNSLKENTIKGRMYPSIFGGSTANTEFEFLTGYSMAFLPFHSVPYSNMIDEKMSSVTWNIKECNYGGNVAFHPGMANSYSRDKVYTLLGFDKHISVEDMKDPMLLRSYVSDDADFKEVEKQYSQYRKEGNKEPYYMFNVTIQNHSDYKLSTGVVKAGISITDSDAREEEAEQYLNCIKKTDEALEGLIGYFKKVKEPTVILFFGDHQPRVGNLFYESLYGKKADDLELEETSRKYKVPFMIWSNYDIKEKDNVEISANYLASYLMNEIDAPLTAYDKYLLKLYESVPVVTANFYKGADGQLYEPKQQSKYSKKLNDYSIVQYNGFVDTKHKLDKLFYLK